MSIQLYSRLYSLSPLITSYRTDRMGGLVQGRGDVLIPHHSTLLNYRPQDLRVKRRREGAATNLGRTLSLYCYAALRVAMLYHTTYVKVLGFTAMRRTACAQQRLDNMLCWYSPHSKTVSHFHIVTLRGHPSTVHGEDRTQGRNTVRHPRVRRWHATPYTAQAQT